MCGLRVVPRLEEVFEYNIHGTCLILIQFGTHVILMLTPLLDVTRHGILPKFHFPYFLSVLFYSSPVTFCLAA